MCPNPVLRDELELQAKYGLKYIRPEIMTGVVFDDDSVFVLHKDLDRTCQSIAKISQHDADAYRQFHDWSIRMLDMLTMGMFNPPPPFGAQMAMMDQSPEGRQLIRAQMISAWDVVDEIFENDRIKIALSRYASEAMINPFVKGTGFALFVIHSSYPQIWRNVSRRRFRRIKRVHGQNDKSQWRNHQIKQHGKRVQYLR
uniref:Uncharacterized protein n=1 Tax=uncultured Desulfobacterium sp. TaxID=201089 RepID=E1YD12_9BACT|nr:hypothetical protein N47_G37800 [uncultured Desulfobacterium sp.]